MAKLSQVLCVPVVMLAFPRRNILNRRKSKCTALFPHHDADMGQKISWPLCNFMPFCLLLYRLTAGKHILDTVHPDRALVHLGAGYKQMISDIMDLQVIAYFLMCLCGDSKMQPSLLQMLKFRRGFNSPKVLKAMGMFTLFLAEFNLLSYSYSFLSV